MEFTEHTGEVAASSAAAKERRFRRRVVAVAIVVGAGAGVGLGATALAGAATSTTTTTTTTTPPSSGSTAPAVPRPAFRGRGLGGLFLGPGILGSGAGGGLVDGQFTVKGPTGAYETLDVRTGTVASVTNTSRSTWSLTVKSADGSKGTFTVNSSTSVNGGEMGIGSVKTGDTVNVVATVSGSTDTATSVTDRTVAQANGKSWLPSPPMPASPPAQTSGSFFFGGPATAS
jgi:hypothetical protein